MRDFREHAPEGEPCWCKEKAKVFLEGHVVGMATPLENGQYSIEFTADKAGKSAEQRISQGAINSISIRDKDLYVE